MKERIFLSLVLTVFAFAPMQTKPALYLIGDSTVRNTHRPQCGWGEKISAVFDTTRIRISNQAMAGRSTRTFIKEGRWEKVLATLKKGDYVILQFGHNEGSKPDTTRAGYRGVLRGVGEDSVQLAWKDGTLETVHSYGWYLKKFIREAKQKGAMPIVCSMIPRNQFADGRVKRADNDFGKWAKEAADDEGAFFVDLNALTANKYDALGPDVVKTYFHGDHTHTNETGAAINAESVSEGLRLLQNCSLTEYLKQK